MQDHARVVIIGSGIAGSSIAYHLAERGWRDILVLDQGEPISGTTAHAPGLVGQLRASVSLTKMLMYSVELYRRLAVDGLPGYSEVGSLRLAASPERLTELQRQAGFARGVGLAAEVIGPREAQRLFPLLDLAGVEGALYLPTDGSARAPILAQALGDAARAHGAIFAAQTRVTGFEIVQGRIAGVATTRGRIQTAQVVVAAGIWSPRLGRLAGVAIPLLPMQHQWAQTGALADLAPAAPLPNVRDPDQLVYFRQDGTGLILGGYERHPAAFAGNAIPDTANPTVLPFDAPRFAPLLAAAQARVPAVAAARIVRQINGLEAFTPDGEFILGEAPEVRGFWAACGFCAHGISGAGGVGRVMAEWMVDGEPSLDLWHMDLRRFGAYAAGRRYLAARVPEIYRTYYDISYPAAERSSARNLRLSPMYGRLEALGAVFGERAGWERAHWFRANEAASAGQGWPEPAGWARRLWSPAIGVEHQVTRERVALFDVTSFAKLEVRGPGATAFLQRICANQVDTPVGRITYTQMLNARGGIACDVTLTRLAADRWLVITGTAFGGHDLAWMRRQLGPDEAVDLADVTSSRCCVGVWGPQARTLVQHVSGDDFGAAAFPYLTAQSVTIGEIPALALRVTYVGELGWEIYAPMEYGRQLWDTLWAAGLPLGAVAAGYRAIESLRLEKGYRYWSTDIQAADNPYEAGLGFAVKPAKGAFLGREALAAARAAGVTRRLCCLTLADPRAIALGGEPILDGERVLGRVTSGGYGYTVRRSIAYGYLPISHASPGTPVTVQLFGTRVAATVQREPLYDPQNAKIKAG